MNKHMPPPVTAPLFVFCFSVIFVCVCYTRNVIINVTSIGRQISELMFLWWPAILYSVLNSVCLLMANKWMMMMMIQVICSNSVVLAYATEINKAKVGLQTCKMWLWFTKLILTGKYDTNVTFSFEKKT